MQLYFHIQGFYICRLNQLMIKNNVFNLRLVIHGCEGPTLCIILCHFCIRDLASADFGSHGDPRTNPLWIPGTDYSEVLGQSKVLLGFLTSWGWLMSLTPVLFKSQLYTRGGYEPRIDRVFMKSIIQPGVSTTSDSIEVICLHFICLSEDKVNYLWRKM